MRIRLFSSLREIILERLAWPKRLILIDMVIQAGLNLEVSLHLHDTGLMHEGKFPSPRGNVKNEVPNVHE